MALTRKFLKAIGIEDEKIDQIIEAHTETVSGLKDSLDNAETAARDLPNVQKDLDDAKAELEAVKKDGWKDKHDALKKEFEAYKADVTAKDTKAAKEAAVRSYFESKGITGKSLDIAMRGSTAEIEALELEDGKIKDDTALDTLVKGDFSGLVSTTVTKGANTPTPPSMSTGKKSMEEIYKKDDNGRYVLSATERQRAIAENMAQDK